jgi:menaquinone-dependent protoporphyrinogen oxidase
MPERAMTSILVVFESTYGQSQKIAEFVADLAQRRGIAATLVRADAVPDSELADHDAVVVVAPIYFGRHSRTIEELLRRYAGGLARVPMAFVSVSNSAGSADADARSNAQRIARAFVQKSRARARLVTTAGGALAYPRYGRILRLVMRLIARRNGGPEDTSRIHELTDWQRLEGDLVPFLDVVEAIRRRRHDPLFAWRGSRRGRERRRALSARSGRGSATCGGHSLQHFR